MVQVSVGMRFDDPIRRPAAIVQILQVDKALARWLGGLSVKGKSRYTNILLGILQTAVRSASIVRDEISKFSLLLSMVSGGRRA